MEITTQGYEGPRHQLDKAVIADERREIRAELHRQAVLHGVTEVELHAQVGARSFYERAGYTAVGDEYEEAGITHVTMRRPLP